MGRAARGVRRRRGGGDPLDLGLLPRRRRLPRLDGGHGRRDAPFQSDRAWCAGTCARTMSASSPRPACACRKRTSSPAKPQAIDKVFAETGWDRAVVKPATGASGYSVELVDARVGGVGRSPSSRPRRAPGVLVQEFLPEIAEGELSLVYFDGVFSHAVRKRPPRGEFRVNSRFGATRNAETPSHGVTEQGATALRALPELPLYARVDGVVRDGAADRDRGRGARAGARRRLEPGFCIISHSPRRATAERAGNQAGVRRCHGPAAGAGAVPLSPGAPQRPGGGRPQKPSPNGSEQTRHGRLTISPPPPALDGAPPIALEPLSALPEVLQDLRPEGQAMARPLGRAHRAVLRAAAPARSRGRRSSPCIRDSWRWGSRPARWTIVSWKSVGAMRMPHGSAAAAILRSSV